MDETEHGTGHLSRGRTPVPDPVSWPLAAGRWPLAKPMAHNGVQYDTLTIGAPTSEDVLKASAVPGASGLDVTLRMIESASKEHVPYDVLKKQPHWFSPQISDYMEEFVGAPAPDPLKTWRRNRREAQRADMKAKADAGAEARIAQEAALAAAEIARPPAS